MKKDNNLDTAERKRGASRTLFKDTLTRVGLENDAQRVREMCYQLWDIALDRTLPLSDRLGYIKIIMDRIDGRPAQAVEINDNTVGLPSATQFKLVKIESKGEE